MARRCTTVPGFGTCCNAFQSGVRSGQTFRVRTASGGERCAVCTIDRSKSKRHPGKPISVFRWAKSEACGLGAGGCPALNPGGNQQAILP